MLKILKLLKEIRPKKKFTNPDFVTFINLCDSEISFCIRHIDGKTEFLLGSKENGFIDRAVYHDIKQGLNWLTEMAARRYPETWYAEMHQILRRSL